MTTTPITKATIEAQVYKLNDQYVAGKMDDAEYEQKVYDLNCQWNSLPRKEKTNHGECKLVEENTNEQCHICGETAVWLCNGNLECDNHVDEK